LTGDSHDVAASGGVSPLSSPTTTATASTGADWPGPSAVLVDKPTWQFCYWFKQWYCYEFQS
jgi:hypothetical protein